MLPEKINVPITLYNSLFRKIKLIHNVKIALEFKWSCLKQGKATFTPRSVVNLIIVCELDTWSQDLKGDFTLKDCLFDAVN